MARYYTELHVDPLNGPLFCAGSKRVGWSRKTGRMVRCKVCREWVFVEREPEPDADGGSNG